MIVTLLCYVPSAVVLALIGLAILLKNPRNKIYLSFFAFVLTIALWLLLLCISYLHINYVTSLWSLRAAVAVGTFIAPALWYFSEYFPVRIGKTPRWIQFLVIAFACVLCVLSFTPWLIPAVEFRQYSVAIRGVGGLYTAQTLYEVIGVITGFGILLRKLRKVPVREKTQILLVVIGLVVAAAVNVVTNFLLVLVHAATYLSDLAAGLSLVVFVAMTAYAIVRHHLFDVRLAIVRAVGFALTIGLVSVVYSLLVLGVGVPLVTNGQVAFVRDNLQLLLLLLPTLVAALTFHSLERFIASHTRSLFYQDFYDTQQVLDKFSDALISDNDLDNIVHKGLEAICEALRPSHVLFVVIDEHGKPVVKQLKDRAEPQDVELLVTEARRLNDRLATKDDAPIGKWRYEFEVEDISLVLRLGAVHELIGVLFLGPKQSGRIYTRRDTDLLSVSAKNFGVAIENAKKYQQIAHFADTMHAEVLHATASLRAANTKLKTLDAMKDDFISMASHQLRSPAASVHDAIKMLEQSYLTSAERIKIIELADASSERLLNVVTDMLSVARIQAGHFTIEKSEVDMTELVDRALLQASALASEKHITTHFERPSEALRIMADRAKMNEIMSNYIENALKYSPDNAQINVSLHQEANNVYFEVADHGIGVPKDARKDLFNKFYRAANARKEHPDGNGIGLFVVKTVVEAHDGGVYYKPLSDGSLFGFWLPSE